MEEVFVYIVLGVIFLLSATLLYVVRKLQALNRRFNKTLGVSFQQETLESKLTAFFETSRSIDKKFDEMKKDLKRLSHYTGRSFQKSATVRFNPFSDTGGNQSFVLALLNQHDDGFLITAIHGREGTRIYIKAVESGVSSQSLSEEEKEALLNAK